MVGGREAEIALTIAALSRKFMAMEIHSAAGGSANDPALETSA
jgi:hypothetical protein